MPIADEYDPPRVLIGETWVRDMPELASYYGEGNELHLAFNFAFATSPFEARPLRDVIEATQQALGVDPWPLWTASNHDIGRLATRWAQGDGSKAQAALFVLLMLRGTPVLYAGDEIALEDVDVPSSRRRDEGSGPGGRSRDGGRTPIPWGTGPDDGFTAPGVEPWLPIGDLRSTVAEQRADPHSTLSWCHRLIELRRRFAALSSGPQELLDLGESVLAWRRGEALIVAANLSSEPARIGTVAGEILIASAAVQAPPEGEDLLLPPWGCVILGA